MYHLEWQSMLIDGVIFAIIGILAAILLRFYTKKITQNNETKDSDSQNVG